MINTSKVNTSYCFLTRNKIFKEYSSNSFLLELFTQKVYGYRGDKYYNLNRESKSVATSSSDVQMSGASYEVETCYDVEVSCGGESHTHKQCVTKIIYISDNNFDTGYKDDGSGGGSVGGGGGGGSIGIPTITETIAFKKSMFKCVRDKLINIDYYNELLKKYGGDNSKMDLVFDMETFGDKFGGFTYLNYPGQKNFDWINGKLTINISFNTLRDNNITFLDYAYYILHESVHASLYYKYYSGDPAVGADFTDLYTRYYAEYKGLNMPLERLHQDEMAEKYLWDMAEALMSAGELSGDPYLNDKDINFYQSFILDNLRASKMHESLSDYEERVIHKEVSDYWKKGSKECK